MKYESLYLAQWKEGQNVHQHWEEVLHGHEQSSDELHGRHQVGSMTRNWWP